MQSKLEIKKTKPSTAAVFKLDREALLPSVLVNIGTHEERKRGKKRQPEEQEEQKCTSLVFGQIGYNPVPRPNQERLQKLLAEFPQAKKPKVKAANAQQETTTTCFTATEWQSTFNKLTGFDIEVEQAAMKETTKPTSSKSLRPSFIESILGKRPTAAARLPKKATGNEDDADENIVDKVETRDDMITFED